MEQMQAAVHALSTERQGIHGDIEHEILSLSLAIAKKIREQLTKTKKKTNMNEAPNYDPNREPIFNYQQIEQMQLID